MSCVTCEVAWRCIIFLKPATCWGKGTLYWCGKAPTFNNNLDSNQIRGEKKREKGPFLPDVSHDATEVTAPLENSADDVTARATESTWYRQQWACNSDQFRIMPSASSQSSMQITAQMENNDLPKNILSLLEKKVRNLEKRKVSFWVWFEANSCHSLRRPRHVDICSFNGKQFDSVRRES